LRRHISLGSNERTDRADQNTCRPCPYTGFVVALGTGCAAIVVRDQLDPLQAAI